jgi:hypothetical protein
VAEYVLVVVTDGETPDGVARVIVELDTDELPAARRIIDAVNTVDGESGPHMALHPADQFDRGMLADIRRAGGALRGG